MKGMTEEKKQLVLRAAKRMTALLIALIMVVEQVPWNAALPIWAKAAVEHEPPDIKGAFNMKTDDSGIQLEKGTITLSKKTRAEGEIQLVANSAATDSTIYDLALHIDPPTISGMAPARCLPPSWERPTGTGTPMARSSTPRITVWRSSAVWKWHSRG